MHKRSLGTRPICTAALAALLGAALGTAAPARFGPPPPPGPRPSTAASAPLPALAAGLRLSAAQQAKVAQIQAQFGRRRRALMPLPPGGGPPPDPGSLRAAWGRMRVLDQSADADIGAALTGPQRADLPALLRTLDALRTAGIPPATYGALKLSASQTARLTVLVHTSRRATGRAMDAARRSGDFGSVRASMRSVRKRLAAQAAAVLTPAQRNTVDSYKAAHPRPPGGGPGGFGPPPPPEERHSRDEDHGPPSSSWLGTWA